MTIQIEVTLAHGVSSAQGQAQSAALQEDVQQIRADLSSPMSRIGWCVLNAILVKLAFAWIFCLVTGSLLFAARSKTCTRCAPKSKLQQKGTCIA